MAKIYLAQVSVKQWRYTAAEIGKPMQVNVAGFSDVVRLVNAYDPQEAMHKVTKYVESMGQMYESFCTIAYADITEAL